MEGLDWLFDAENALPMALSVGGFFAQRKALQDAQERRRRALAELMTQDQGYANQMAGLVDTRAQEFSPAMREPVRQAAEGAAYDSLSGALVQARETPPAGSDASGRMSQDFLVAKARRAVDDLTAGADRARMMAKVRSTGDQGLTERIGGGEMGSQLGAIQGNRQAALRSGQLQADIAGQPSGGLMLAGDLARLGASTLLGQRLQRAAMSRPTPGSMTGG